MIKLLLLLLLPGVVSAAEIINDENQAPWIILKQIHSPDGTVEATNYISTEEKHPNIWRQDTYLEIIGSSGTWRVDPPSNSHMINVLEFIDESHLMIELQTILNSSTAILNIETR